MSGIRITTYPDGGFRSLVQYDNANGAFISWWTQGIGQRVQWIKTGSAENAKQWEENGIPIALNVGGEPVSIVKGQVDEWILSFQGQERRAFSQKFDTTGVRLWGDSGKVVWPNEVSDYYAVPDNRGGAIVIANLFDTYFAQRIDSAGHYTGETGVDDAFEEGTPYSCSLKAPYPNPFNSSTKIDFDIPKNGLVTLSIYNPLGKEVTRLIDGFRNAGGYSLEWNGNNKNGDTLPSGVYFVCIVSDGEIHYRKVTLIK